jgi:hypothetical protein
VKRALAALGIAFACAGAAHCSRSRASSQEATASVAQRDCTCPACGGDDIGADPGNGDGGTSCMDYATSQGWHELYCDRGSGRCVNDPQAVITWDCPKGCCERGHGQVDAGNPCTPPNGNCLISSGWYQGWCTSLCQYASACLCVQPDPQNPNLCLQWSDEWSKTGCPGPNPCGLCQ